MLLPRAVIGLVVAECSDFATAHRLALLCGVPLKFPSHLFVNAARRAAARADFPYLFWLNQKTSILSSAVVLEAALQHAQIEVAEWAWDLCPTVCRDPDSLLKHAVWSGSVAAVRFVLSHYPDADVSIETMETCIKVRAFGVVRLLRRSARTVPIRSIVEQHGIDGYPLIKWLRANSLPLRDADTS
jgi:hypothetical protein